MRDDAPGLHRVVVTGGGTAGHVIPSMPVIEELLRRGVEVHFIGSRSGLEERLVAPLGIHYHGVDAGKLRRYFSLRNITDAFRVPLGVAGAWRLLGRIRPDVVFSKGGFVSFPACVGGWLRRIPLVIHESDLTPGLTTKLIAPLAATVCVNFEQTRVRGKRVVATGTPIRPALTEGDAGRGRTVLGIGTEGGRPIMLVVGGSTGAERLNEVVREALDALLEDYVVVHVCGPGKTDPRFEGRGGYIQLEFVADGWGDIIAAADFVVSRAGANALYEWVALGKPNLLVPLPRSASRGDQIENAEYAARQGLSRVLLEEGLNRESLIREVTSLAGSLAAHAQTLAAHSIMNSTALIVGELERAAAP